MDDNRNLTLNDEHEEENPIFQKDINVDNNPQTATPSNTPNTPHIEDEEEGINIAEFAENVLIILKPVSITMLIVIWAVRVISSQPATQQISIALAYQENSNDSTGRKLLGSLINALIFVVLITLTTIVFVLLYKYRCMKVIYGWLVIATGMLLAMFGGFIFFQLLQSANIPMDYVTFSILLWNFVVVGILSMYWYAPAIINRAYLIAVSAIMAVVFTYIPEWTTWALLAAIAIYDLFAVLCPRGPLRQLVELSQQRQETIPALLYNGSIFMMMVNETRDDDYVEINESTGKGIKLGLGDFVFYSVLVGRAALFDMITVFTCFVAIITGLFFTIILLGVFRKALPALPISIFFGFVFFFTTRFLLVPYIMLLGANSVFV